MRLGLLSLLMLPLAVGCGNPDDDDDDNEDWRSEEPSTEAESGAAIDDTGSPACPIESLTGAVTMTMDGTVGNTGSSGWSSIGDGVQINMTFDDLNVSTTVRAMIDESGYPIVDQIDAEAFPIHATLTGDSGSAAVLNHSEGASYASNQGGGSGRLTILSIEDTSLSACFDFVAVHDDGGVLEVTDGMVRADELSR